MTASPRHGQSTHSVAQGRASGVARAAVVVAEVVAVVLVLAYSIFAVVYAVGGDAAVSDNVVGHLAGIALVGGLFASLVAFLMAVVARIRRERPRLLWLPLALFPVLLVAVVGGRGLLDGVAPPSLGTERGAAGT